MGAKGYSCGLWIDPSGRKWLDFVYDADELVLAVQGNIRLKVNREAVGLGPGDEALIPAEETPSVYTIGGTEARWFHGYRR